MLCFRISGYQHEAENTDGRQQAALFQRFYRGQEAAAQEGVGLGLYLANGIVTRQKGYISVKSRVGKGTAFSVYLLS